MTTLLKSSFLNSKLAKRTLILFILCALVPMVVLSLLTSEQVNQLYQEQQQRELHRAAKSMGLLLFERIQFLQRQTLSAHRTLSTVNKESLTDYFQQPQSGIEQVVVIDPSATIHQPAWFQQLKELPQGLNKLSAERAHVIVSQSTGNLWLAYHLNTTGASKVVGFKIDHTGFWQNLNDYDLSKVFRIYNSNDQLLYSTTAPQAENSSPTNSSYNTQHRASWKLLLGPETNADTLRVEATTHEKDLLLEQEEFQQLVRLTTLLAILLASLASIYAIRRNTSPIQILHKGIEQIKNNRFDHPVNINSGDEFEVLGETFNNMARKLGQHITAMQSLSAIDQLILDRLKIEDIIDVVIVNGIKLLQAQRLYFLIYSEQDQNFSLYTSDSLHKENIDIDLSQLNLLHNPGKFIHWEETNLSNSIIETIAPHTLVYSSVLWQSDNAKAVLIAEFNQQPELDLLDIIRSFVEHVTVALSNADWEEKLFQQAHYDFLTGLPNRYLFSEQLTNAIEQAGKTGQKLGLFFIDIDEFKAANDSLGHAAGDKLLATMASRFSSDEGGGLVSRLGGDEFVIIYSCDMRTRRSVVEETAVVAERLRSAALAPIDIDHMALEHSISIGIAIYPDDSESPEELLQHADNAMYQAKSDGKNNVRYYSKTHNSSSIQREEMVAELHRALANNEFELHYQPKVNLKTAVIDGCEALIRWNHPERGLLPPSQFILKAEQYGVISEIGRWVIREAARQQVEWKQRGIQAGRIAVNVSVLQLLNKNFCNDVITILNDVGCQGNDLEFEITETAYVEDMNNIHEALDVLGNAGIIFSVDDYGTGYGSLSLLFKLPISKVKIDKSFIDHIENDGISRAIVESTIKLAQEMNLSVVAEGVENPGQLALLMSCGCNSVQGYIFSKPLPVHAFQSLFKENSFSDIQSSTLAQN